MDLMAPVTHHQNVLPREELPLELVLPHLESVVSSPSPVEVVAVPIIPMQLSIPSMLQQTRTHVSTLSVKPIQMYAN